MSDLRIKELEKENAQLKKEIEKLKAILNMNSSNSSFPPSSDRFKKKIKTKDLFVRKVINLLEDKLVIKEVLLIKLIIQT